MTPDEQAAYVAKLEASIAETRQLIEDLTEATQPISPDDAYGRLSRMDAINNKAVSERNLREAKLRLQRMENILQLAGTDRFGTCVKCKQSIPQARLMALPDTLVCTACAAKS